MTQQTVNWLGYEFEVYNYEPISAWSDVPAVYIFAGLNQGGAWFPLYIGETGSLARRLANHEQWPPARRLGATHVHARVVQQETQRLQLEQFLIQGYSPPLNQEHRI